MQLCYAKNLEAKNLEAKNLEAKNLEAKNLEECLVLDNRIAHHMIEAADFYEGVRALLIDKDNSPLWQPDTLEQVTPDKVAAHFTPVEREISC